MNSKGRRGCERERERETGGRRTSGDGGIVCSTDGVAERERESEREREREGTRERGRNTHTKWMVTCSQQDRKRVNGKKSGNRIVVD